MRFGSKSGTAELGIEFFPTPLGTNRMPKGLSDFWLSGQSGLAESNGDDFEMGVIVKGNAIKDFMSAEENPKTITIIKPERRIDKGALDMIKVRGICIGVKR
jgi:hypothetical protein